MQQHRVVQFVIGGAGRFKVHEILGPEIFNQENHEGPDMEISFLIPAFLQGVGVVALVSISYDVLLHHRSAGWLRSVLVALIFTLAVLGTMANPVAFGDGVFFDLRHVLLVLAAPFGGLPAALVTGVAACVYRLWIGGAGAAAGVAGILISVSLGALTLTYLRLQRPSFKRSILVGLMPSVSLLSLGLLPFEMIGGVLKAVAAPMVIGNFIGAIVVLTLLERRKSQAERETELQVFAHSDKLTGLPNRLKFETAASLLIGNALAQERQVALMVMDIDHFKQVNDTFGHAAGDVILADVARVLKREMRDGDLVARYGGEEFVALIPVDSEAEAHVAAERICKSVSRSRHEVRGVKLTVTISIGVQLIDGTEFSLHELMEFADGALYSAKAHGRNRVELAVAA